MKEAEADEALSLRPGRGAPLLALCFALALLVGGLGWRTHARHRLDTDERARRAADVAAGVTVVVARVVAAPATLSMTATGEVRPWRQASIYPRVDGYLKQITVDKGDHVKKGDLLAALTAPEADHQLGSARAEYRLRQGQMRRADVLRREGLASEQEFERASGEMQVAQAEVSRLGALRGYQVIRAPFDGVVIGRHVDPGTLLTAPRGSLQDGTSIVDIADVTRARVYVHVAQREASLVSPGDTVQLLPDADPRNARDEKVTRTTGAIDPRTRTMLVEIDVDNTKQPLLPGSFVRVRFSLEARPALSIPAEAIAVRAGKRVVAIVKDGRASFTPVETGETDGRSVRVFSGVHEGDLVALFPGDDIVDRGPVQAVLKDENRADSAKAKAAPKPTTDAAKPTIDAK